MGSRCVGLMVLTVLLVAGAVHAQGTAADYERSRTLSRTLRGTVNNDKLSPRWIEEGRALTFVRQSREGGFEIIRVDTTTGKQTIAFNRKRAQRALAMALSQELGSSVDADETEMMRSATGDDSKTYFAARHAEQIYFGRLEDNGKAILLEPNDDHPLKLTALPPGYPYRRQHRGTEVELAIFNDTEQVVELFYVSSNSRRSYGKIDPGQVRYQRTFGGHRWLAVGEDGEDLMGFVATDEFAVAHITGKLTRDEYRRKRWMARQRGTNVFKADEGNETPENLVFDRDHNLYLRANENDDAIPLTTDGTGDASYGGPYTVSPDGRFVVARHTVQGDNRMVSFVESSPNDQLQPKLITRQYDKPGDQIDISWPVLVDTREGKIVEIDRELFDNPFWNRRVRWNPSGESFTFLYNQRGHQALRLIEVDAESGAARAVIDETSDTFVNYSNKTELHILDDTDEVIWMSERSGWNHLYLIDRLTGEVKNAITSGDWVVREIMEIDEANRLMYLKVLGVHRGQDPYYEHVARVNLDGSGFVLLTASNGTHNSVSFSPDKSKLVVSWSRVDQPPVHELRDGVTGKLIAELGRADAGAWHKQGVPLPEPFAAKGRDGETDIYGVIYRPSTFNKNRKYPVIEKIYAGPHGYHVPKQWRTMQSAQAVAELGFIVVQIDGMGTNWRSKAFHDVAWKNIKDAGFPDRIAWMRAAAKRYRYMDIERVGIFGGSAGGQNALGALLFHGDFYDAASADCGCHDNRMDKVWWNEAWMGWPVDESYAASSNVDHAHRLEGKLLLMVGEMDTNVDPASTMQVVDALIEADKDFELIVFPGGGHGAGSSAYGKRRMYDFFVRNLWEKEPRRER